MTLAESNQASVMEGRTSVDSSAVEGRDGSA
jgi:hypothetical protein